MTGPSETMVVAAYGNIFVLDTYGNTLDQYGTLSVISTTVFDAAPTGAYNFTFTVSAPAVAMMVSSSWPSSTGSASTSYPFPGSGPDHHFHLWHLSFVVTIIVLILIGVGACMFACCFYCCLRRCCRRRQRYNPYPLRQVPNMSSYPLSATPSTTQTLPPVTQPEAQTAPPVTRLIKRKLPPSPPVDSAAFCAHKKSSSCFLSNPSCCSCLDQRPEPLTKVDRMKHYCSYCRTYWSRISDAEFLRQRPPAKPAGPESLEPSRISRCSHVISCRTIFTARAGSCCACNDERRQLLTLDERLSHGYCLSCSLCWRKRPLSELPPEWEMREVVDHPRAQRKDDPVLYASEKPTLQPLRGPPPSDETHGQMYDLGPKYVVAPRPRPPLGDENGLSSVFELRLKEGDGQDGSSSDEQRDTSRRKVNISYPSESVSGNILDDGPTSRRPVFQVPATRRVSRNDAHEETGEAVSNASSARPGKCGNGLLSPRDERSYADSRLVSSTNTAKKQRRSRGLQREQPRFSVNPDGTLKDG
jgi:hypothetical protein